MTRDLTTYLERKTKSTTAELKASVEANGPVFEAGQWWKTTGDHTVRITRVGPLSIDGTIWKSINGQRSCFGQFTWFPSGRYFDTTDSIHDLKAQVEAPQWAEDLGIAA